MSCALVSRILFCAVLLGTFSPTAEAGGYGGGSSPFSAMAPQQAQAILTYADQYRDGDFKVGHTESAGAAASIHANGETGSGTAYSNTSVENSAGVTSWKRSIQRTRGDAKNGKASGSGFTASFVKVRTDDGKYYMFKGIANTSASAGAAGTAKSKWGLAKSRGGRY
jgi:hypothetical protein